MSLRILGVMLACLLGATALAGLPALNLSNQPLDPAWTVVTSSPTVLIEGLPALRVGDAVVSQGGRAAIVVGSPTVLIEGLPAAHQGSTWAGPTGSGGFAPGSSTVLVAN